MSLRFRLALWIAVAETIFLALFLLADLSAAQSVDLGRTSFIFVGGMAVNGLIAMIIAHVFTRRLSDLADAADAIAAGNPHYCIVAAGDDDIARLGRAFNNIVARMENHLRHVKESRDRLIKPTEAMSEGLRPLGPQRPPAAVQQAVPQDLQGDRMLDQAGHQLQPVRAAGRRLPDRP